MGAPMAENEPILIVQRKHKKSTTKSINKVKSTLKQMICRCCFYLTHIFEISRFEVLISRFFWACFSKPPDFHVIGVGRSANYDGIKKNIILKLKPT